MKNTAPPHNPEFAIDVQVLPQYLPEHSSPAQERFVFAYTITISNTGLKAAQLISRYWLIEDAKGKTEEVHGLGVVGEQPLLQPGERFQYTSGCPLATPYGTMQGHYFFVGVDGERFEVDIPLFVLNAHDSPQVQGVAATGIKPVLH